MVAEVLSPGAFPDVIKAFNPADIANYQKVFLSHTGEILDTKQAYDRHTSSIAMLTGHENAINRSGRPYNRSEWEEALGRSWRYLNQNLNLGFSDEMLEVVTLCYTALKSASRFGNDPAIEPVKGENTAVHSTHTLLQSFYVHAQALHEEPALANDPVFFQHFQMSCILLMVHDFGEQLGEPGSLADADHHKTMDAKDKYEFEKTVFDYTVRLAIKTVFERKDSKYFYDILDAVKDQVSIQNAAHSKSDESMTQELIAAFENLPADLLGVFDDEPKHIKTSKDIKLPERGQGLFNFLKKSWEWVETPDQSPLPFLGYFSGMCERIQGTRHINRHFLTAQSQVIDDQGRSSSIPTVRLMPSSRFVSNARYCESRAAFLCDAANPQNVLQKTLTDQVLTRNNTTIAELLENMPEAFFLDSSIKELAFHTDGSAFSARETAQRQREIQLAYKIAEMEEKARCDDADGLPQTFNKHSYALGGENRIAIKREHAVAFYREAIAQRYWPKLIIGTHGKKTPEILILSRPKELCGDDIPLGENQKTTKATIDQMLEKFRHEQ